ncbi:MAG TPA: AtpZ/AtpI family protein [Firmicutes bacterium]|nr:AtpZ/AtpI family protein [Bacillota bacterium]
MCGGITNTSEHPRITCRNVLTGSPRTHGEAVIAVTSRPNDPGKRRNNRGVSSLVEAMRAAGPLFGLGIQFAIMVGLGVFVGHWLDQRYEWDPWGALIGGIVGIALGFYQFFRAVSSGTDKSEKRNDDST